MHKSAIRRNDVNYPVARPFNEFAEAISVLRFQGIEHTELLRGGDVERNNKKSFSGLTLGMHFSLWVLMRIFGMSVLL